MVNGLGKDGPGVALSGHRILLADHPLKHDGVHKNRVDIAGVGARGLQLGHQVSNCSEEQLLSSGAG